jgi:hypothetical protein
MSHITESQFRKKFISLVFGGRDFPKKRENLHVLLKSATMGLKEDHTYSQQELTQGLGPWVEAFGNNFNIDAVMLRRLLVDEGYLTRDPAGNVYELSSRNPPFSFDDSIRSLDPEIVIMEEKEKRELKKQRYMGSIGSNHSSDS